MFLLYANKFVTSICQCQPYLPVCVQRFKARYRCSWKCYNYSFYRKSNLTIKFWGTRIFWLATLQPQLLVLAVAWIQPNINLSVCQFYNVTCRDVLVNWALFSEALLFPHLEINSTPDQTAKFRSGRNYQPQIGNHFTIFLVQPYRFQFSME